MNISIRTIEHREQRYPTTGDWWFSGNADGSEKLHIAVSNMNNWRYEMLIGVHECIEALLCRHDGVSEETVTAFDNAFEKARTAEQRGRGAKWRKEKKLFLFHARAYALSMEPGDCFHAPYYRQHQIATGVERVLATLLGVSWNDYEAANEALYGR